MKNQTQTAELDFSRLDSLYVSKEADRDMKIVFKKHLCFLMNLPYSDDIFTQFNIDIEYNDENWWNYHNRQLKNVSVKIKNSNTGYKVPYMKTLFRLTADKSYSIRKMADKLDELKAYIDNSRAEIEKKNIEEQKSEKMDKYVKNHFPVNEMLDLWYVSVDVRDGSENTTISLDVKESVLEDSNLSVSSCEITITDKDGNVSFDFDYHIDFQNRPSRKELDSNIVLLTSFAKRLDTCFNQIIKSLK
jgi:hypothetical protein